MYQAYVRPSQDLHESAIVAVKAAESSESPSFTWSLSYCKVRSLNLESTLQLLPVVGHSAAIFKIRMCDYDFRFGASLRRAVCAFEA